MKAAAIEKLPEIKEATRVLQELEKLGINEATIASGWLRGFLTDTQPSDIDILYVGPIHYEEAQRHLKRVTEKLSVNSKDWDINGIWNAELAWKFPHVKESILVYYVSSVDSVYLGSDGRLHDPTGYGFSDAESKILRLNEHLNPHLPHSDAQMVYFLLEGCRRIAKFGWKPTERSVELIRNGIWYWTKLDEKTKQISYKKLKNKYNKEERRAVRKIYDQYGWGFVFDGVND